MQMMSSILLNFHPLAGKQNVWDFMISAVSAARSNSPVPSLLPITLERAGTLPKSLQAVRIEKHIRLIGILSGRESGIDPMPINTVSLIMNYSVSILTIHLHHTISSLCFCLVESLVSSSN